ncbi:cytochrome P450 [Streptosporangium sp. NPDC004379]|uniref:cytochrome P450 n=1 Tax=Streptosporangium sp. NPDC004379 TaxID=3366189 RepID=UPI0036A95464
MMRDFSLDWPSPLDPPALLSELDAEKPVFRVRMPSGDTGYLVTRYDDVVRVLSDPVFSRAWMFRPGAPRYSDRPIGLPDSLLNLDPPEHGRLRRAVSRAFTPRRVEAMRAGVEEVAEDLLDRMEAAGGPTDLVEAFCAPLPVSVICRLFGVPEADRPGLRKWIETALSLTAHSAEESFDALMRLHGYFTDLGAARRAEPGDDLLSTLITAPDRRDELTDAELVGVAGTIIGAGFETTVHQLAISAYVLLRDPERYAGLRREPGGVPAAVEELLRMTPAVHGTARIATEDVEVGGERVPAGSMVLAWTAAANRDPGAFSGATALDLGRSRNDHLTFGHGPHFCLGAGLARVELRAGLAALLRRFPDLRLAADPAELRWRSGMVAFGPHELPVRW